jgi:hypothetical protein
MIARYKKLIITGLGLLILPATSLAAETNGLKGAVSSMLKTVGNTAKYDTSDINLWDVVGKYVAGSFFVAGVVFMIMTIYAGYQWMTAGGNAQQVATAQARIRNSVIGVVVVFIAYSFTQVVIEISCQATGVLCGS